MEQGVEVTHDALIETIEAVTLVLGEASIGRDGPQQAGGQRRVHALEEFQKDEADRIPMREQAIAIARALEA